MIDSHMHLWEVARGDYGWLTPDLPIHRDFTLADAHASAPGLDGVILVQAAPTEAETRYLLDIAERSAGFVRGVVGWCDLAAEDAPERVAALARTPLLCGLRPMLQDIVDPDWILRKDVARGLEAMAATGLVLDLLIKPMHLPRCLILAARHPGLIMVIDHCAKPEIAAGAWSPWAADIEQIANETALFCKLSGLVTEAGGNTALQDILPYARHVLGVFGPERLLWGSDWPVVTLCCSHADWLGAAHALLADLPATQHQAVFATNALRVYGRPNTP